MSSFAREFLGVLTLMMVLVVLTLWLSAFTPLRTVTVTWDPVTAYTSGVAIPLKPQAILEYKLYKKNPDNTWTNMLIVDAPLVTTKLRAVAGAKEVWHVRAIATDPSMFGCVMGCKFVESEPSNEITVDF